MKMTEGQVVRVSVPSGGTRNNGRTQTRTRTQLRTQPQSRSNRGKGWMRTCCICKRPCGTQPALTCNKTACKTAAQEALAHMDEVRMERTSEW